MNYRPRAMIPHYPELFRPDLLIWLLDSFLWQSEPYRNHGLSLWHVLPFPVSFLPVLSTNLFNIFVSSFQLPRHENKAPRLRYCRPSSAGLTVKFKKDQKGSYFIVKARRVSIPQPSPLLMSYSLTPFQKHLQSHL